MTEHRVLVCGGRHYSDTRAAFRFLDRLDPKPTRIIEGGQHGADELARRWAIARGVECDTYDAEWHKHGRAAGPLRNQRMIDEGKPDLVVAFPGGIGTADMVRRAKDAGIQVVEAK